MSALFAHTVVWRVIEIVHTTTTLDGKPRVLTGLIRYRWTKKGAFKLRDQLARAASADYSGSGFVVQAGIVHWVPDDEWNAAVEATEWSREHNVDDRDEHGPAVTWTRARRKSAGESR